MTECLDLASDSWQYSHWRHNAPKTFLYLQNIHNLICIYVLVHPEQFVSLYQAQRDVAGTLTRVEIMFLEIMHMTGDAK
jgi:predicted DNA-binding protein (MmcQ/YjbR family)